VKQADRRDMFKRPPKVSVHQPLWYLLTPCLLLPSTSSAMKMPENTEEEADDPESACE